MTRRIPFIVSFFEETHYTVALDAIGDTDALDHAKDMCETLSSNEKARAFTRVASGYTRFDARPQLKPFRVVVEAKAIYEIELEAIDREDAEERAEDKWNAHGPEDFGFEDFEDVRFQAAEVER